MRFGRSVQKRTHGQHYYCCVSDEPSARAIPARPLTLPAKATQPISVPWSLASVLSFASATTCISCRLLISADKPLRTIVWSSAIKMQIEPVSSTARASRRAKRLTRRANSSSLRTRNRAQIRLPLTTPELLTQGFRSIVRKEGFQIIPIAYPTL